MRKGRNRDGAKQANEELCHPRRFRRPWKLADRILFS